MYRRSIFAAVRSLAGRFLIVLAVPLGVGLRVSLAKILVVVVLLVVLTVDVVAETLQNTRYYHKYSEILVPACRD